MKLVWWMLAGSILSSFVMTVLFGMENKLEIWIGMLAPLAAAILSWISMERQYMRRPEGLTSLLIKAFAVKVVFFGAYVAIVLSSGLVRPIPFAVSFIVYFLGLHIVEAVGLHRLQASDPPAPSGALQGKL
jgi:hypothetical protein